MLLINPTQYAVLAEKAQDGFEIELTKHLETFSPILFKTIGEKQMREVVSVGLRRAKKYHLNLRGPVRFYLEMMLLFGSSFDTDPQYPWAAKILSSGGTEDQMDRAMSMFENAQHYRIKVSGPSDEYTFQALKRILLLTRAPLDIDPGPVSESLLSKIADTYPQKSEHIGRQGLLLLIKQAMAVAQRNSFSTHRSVFMLVVLMSAFGHGCTNDLLYPWIANTLNDPLIVSSEARAKRLETKAITWLEHVLARSDEMGPL
jgi:hypothetical protein